MAEAPCLNCVRLEREVAELRAQVKHLTRLLDEQRRAGKRQAAPFAKGPPKPEPKKPGRKPGKDYGTKAHREPPQQIDEVHDAPLPDQCPDCGGAVAETYIDQQYQVEIPRRPIHRQFNIHIGCCQKCRRRVQGRHPLQTSDALGAAAAQLGPDAQAAVVEFNKQAGMSHGKISRVFQTLFGISLTRGGSTHVVLRAARRCQPVYKSICETIKASPWTVLDETGWHVGGTNAWLHDLVGPDATAYVIDPTRSSQVAERILGRDYAGVMIHDGWSPYDTFPNARHQQCLGHLLRRCDELLETARRGAVRFPRCISELLRGALDLRDRHQAGKLSTHGLAVLTGRLHNRLLDAIYPSKSNEANEIFAQHLWNHKDDLLTFLKFPTLDATNWRAELAIRFGVILRKVWGGNRTWIGARTQAVLMSVWRTCWQRGQNAVD
ncbi:MAG TPA: IS66 family transposase, partial [Pirellulaceae bacterium]|nr:IS66 family transposase [Pirellulaceae bacterium]